MSESMGSARTSEVGGKAAISATQDGGLIDVNGKTFGELSALLSDNNLGRALDYILASGQNGLGYHGFNNHIPPK